MDTLKSSRAVTSVTASKSDKLRYNVSLLSVLSVRRHSSQRSGAAMFKIVPSACFRLLEASRKAFGESLGYSVGIDDR